MTSLNQQRQVDLYSIVESRENTVIRIVWLAETYGIDSMIMMSIEYQEVGSLLNSYLNWTGGRVLGLVNTSLSHHVTKTARHKFSISSPNLSQFRNIDHSEIEASLRKDNITLLKIDTVSFSPNLFPKEIQPCVRMIMHYLDENNQTFGEFLDTGSGWILIPEASRHHSSCPIRVA